LELSWNKFPGRRSVEFGVLLHVDFLRRWLAFLGRHLMRRGVDLRCELVQGSFVMSMVAAGGVMDEVAAGTIM
jgi:hypothetical protein